MVDKVTKDIEIDMKDETDMEQVQATSRKVMTVIQQLIVKDNMIMIAMDSKVRNERFISLDVNVDLSMIPQLSGGTGNFTNEQMAS